MINLVNCGKSHFLLLVTGLQRAFDYFLANKGDSTGGGQSRQDFFPS